MNLPSWSASAQVATVALRFRGTFTEAHILAIAQAICDYRVAKGTDGPIYIGKDTHALSGTSTAHSHRGPGSQRSRNRNPTG